MAHRGGLSPAFVAMMLNKNLKKPLAPSDASARNFTPLEEILGSAPAERPRVAVSDNLARQARTSPLPVEPPWTQPIASIGRAGGPLPSDVYAMPQTYRSPSLEEILSDRPEQKDRVATLDKSQTGGTSVGSTRSNPVQIAANSVTVPLPIYAVPSGYQPSGDGTNMYLRDRSGNLVKNPLLQKTIDNFKFNKCGIAADLGGIAGESAAGGLGTVGAAVGGVVAAGSNTIKGLCS
jgi:hypothetical protein